MQSNDKSSMSKEDAEHFQLITFHERIKQYQETNDAVKLLQFPKGASPDEKLIQALDTYGPLEIALKECCAVATFILENHKAMMFDNRSIQLQNE